MEHRTEIFQSIDLRSDTVTKPCRNMREAMANAEVGDDVFGEDPTVNRLQELSSQIFNTEAALYVASGTMGNEIAIKTHTQPGDEIIIEAKSHIYNFESGAPGLLSGINMHSIHGENGVITAEQIKKAIRLKEHHYPTTRLICLENTHNYAGGAVFPLDEIERIADVARNNSIKMHLDGARIFNAVVSTGIEPDKYAQYFDSITFCVSKGLGAPVGSVLMGNHEFINSARKYRKMFGGGMRQAGIIAAAGIYALEHNVKQLSEDHKNAKHLAAALQKTKTFDVNLDNVQSNIVIFRLNDTTLTPVEAASKLADYGILVFPFGENQLRAVTHRDVSDEDIDEVSDRLLKYF